MNIHALWFRCIGFNQHYWSLRQKPQPYLDSLRRERSGLFKAVEKPENHSWRVISLCSGFSYRVQYNRNVCSVPPSRYLLTSAFSAEAQTQKAYPSDSRIENGFVRIVLDLSIRFYKPRYWVDRHVRMQTGRSNAKICLEDLPKPLPPTLNLVSHFQLHQFRSYNTIVSCLKL